MTDTPKVTLRPAVPTDADALSALAARTFYSTFAPYNTPANMDTHAAQSFSLAKQLAEIISDNMTTLVYESDDLAAFAQIRDGARPACVTAARPLELWRFYVDTPYHGLGIAQQLMQAVMTHAALCADAVWLGVWENNARALAFYRKCGFVDVGFHVFRLGDDMQTDRIMLLDLTGAV